MSNSPATPSKSTMDAAIPSIIVAVPSLEKLTYAAKVKQESLNEPSPASTYGDTAVGDSVPATPQDSGDKAPSTGLVDSMRAAQIDDIIKVVSAVSGSPNAARHVKHSVRSAHQSDATRGAMVEPFASPSKARGSAKSSPTGSRYKDLMNSPSWRREQKKFVRDTHSQGDDPFVSDPSPSKGSGQGNSFQPRQDRVNVQLSGDNAQAVLPPNACVFVANLSSQLSDGQLEHLVTETFSVFGNVYVKIRRDNKGMPFAFCQYEDAHDSERAIVMGRNLLIDDRPCRTERAKVNRSLYLSKVTGDSISEAEARRVLAKYGELERVWYCSQTEKEIYHLPEGIWTKFAYFQDCRDAQAAFRDEAEYRLEQPKVPEDIRNRGTGHQGYSPGTYGRPGFVVTSLGRRPEDYRSVFVGNLPFFADEQQLRYAFARYGHINNVQIIHKPGANNPYGANCFAFIEFANEADAVSAVENPDRPIIQGTRLRIERKDVSSPPRNMGSPRSKASPRSGYGTGYPFFDPKDAYTAIFQHGVSVGMANAAAMYNSGSNGTLPPPVFAPYNYLQQVPQAQFQGAQYGSFATHSPTANDNNSAGIHNNTYMSQAMDQGQLQQGQGTFAQAPNTTTYYAAAPPRAAYVCPPYIVSGEVSGATYGPGETRQH